MEIIIQPTYQQITAIASDIIRDALIKKPNLVLGLATGSTPIGLYETLVRMHQEGGLDFSEVTTFNLDEYIGISLEHPQSYHTFMAEHLFRYVNIPVENRHIPLNNAKNHEEFCEEYEAAIVRAGGIDIQLLGIGTNGHIGFNEVGSSLTTRTRVVTLTESTLKANAVHFNDEVGEVPDMAISMGIGTIMDAKQCLLLASGTTKADAVAKTVEGPITSMVPASFLQMHPNTVVLIDEAAASDLKEAEYYKRSWTNKLKLLS